MMGSRKGALSHTGCAKKLYSLKTWKTHSLDYSKLIFIKHVILFLFLIPAVFKNVRAGAGLEIDI